MKSCGCWCQYSELVTVTLNSKNGNRSSLDLQMMGLRCWSHIRASVRRWHCHRSVYVSQILTILWSNPCANCLVLPSVDSTRNINTTALTKLQPRFYFALATMWIILGTFLRHSPSPSCLVAWSRRIPLMLTPYFVRLQKSFQLGLFAPPKPWRVSYKKDINLHQSHSEAIPSTR